jgi:hypothetical protein
VSDDVYTTSSPSNVSHYLKATNFGFSIPVGATINGILVEVERRNHTGTGIIKDSAAKIVKADGSIGSTNKADTINEWPSDDTYKSYGANNDLWDESWTPTDINNANFGFVLSSNNTAFAQGDIDHIRITVYFETPSGSDTIIIKNGIIKGDVIFK